MDRRLIRWTAIAGAALLFATHNDWALAADTDQPQSAATKAAAPAGSSSNQVLAPSTDAVDRSPLALPLKYPTARRSDHVDVYHGEKVPDPYRWLEDPRSEETRAWIEAQNRLSSAFLDAIPQRAWIHQRLETLWNYERYGLPSRRGERYFYLHNNGLQNQSVLYTTSPGFENPRVLLDPNTWSADGTTSLAGYQISDDGKLLAYGISKAGSDWREWKVLDVATGRDLPDHLQWIKFSSVSWLPDGSGFYYSRYAEPNEETRLEDTNYFQKLYFHRIGDPQGKDRLVYERPDQKEWGFSPHVTDDGRYLVITVWRGSQRKNDIFVQDLSQPNAPVVEVIRGFQAEYDFVTNVGSRFYFRTDHKADMGRVVVVDVAPILAAAGQGSEGSQKPANVPHVAEETLIAEAEYTLNSVQRVSDQLFATYLQDAHSVVRRYNLEGELLGELKLPGLGTVTGIAGRAVDQEAFYGFTSFTAPNTIYRYDLDAEETEIWRQPKVAFDPERYETKQVFATSRDGTKVPVFLVHRRGLKLNGDLPTLLYGYGGFNIPITPSFSVASLVWMEMGGVNAVAVLRGGGEYGKPWHEAGQKHTKQNVFDDFIAAAQWLIDNGYTRPQRLAISGRSNGGLLVGAAMTQRPELFGAALPAVGVLDMLRFHKFTIGWAWVSEYGSSDDPEEFRSLKAYSPLHNVRPGTKYPATLVTTADHDDRVVPAHSYKFTAALQAAQGGDAPILIRIETSAGHGAGTPISKLIDEAADRLAFLAHVLNVPVPKDE